MELASAGSAIAAYNKRLINSVFSSWVKPAGHSISSVGNAPGGRITDWLTLPFSRRIRSKPISLSTESPCPLQAGSGHHQRTTVLHARSFRKSEQVVCLGFCLERGPSPLQAEMDLLFSQSVLSNRQTSSARQLK